MIISVPFTESVPFIDHFLICGSDGTGTGAEVVVVGADVVGANVVVVVLLLSSCFDVTGESVTEADVVVVVVDIGFGFTSGSGSLF